MIDLNKRDSLKKLGMAGIATAATGASAMAIAFESAESILGATTESGMQPRSYGVTDLKIDIIQSSNLQLDTVLLSNLTDEDMLIRHFRPGSIYWDNQYLDLNALRANSGDSLALQVPALSAISVSARSQTASNLNPMEYVWADDAIDIIDHQTTKVSLGAFVVDHQLLVYPIPGLSIAA